MSKAHMVVLSFISAAPMHGYQIGQLVERYDLPHWTGITQPSIYKAMQSLEKAKYIRGEEMREGNAPPRKVYHLNPSGKKYLKKIVCGYLSEFRNLDLDWWMALFFAKGTMQREEFISLLQERIRRLKEVRKLKHRHRDEKQDQSNDPLPFIHEHLISLGSRYIRSEISTLNEIIAAVNSGAHDDFFIQEGELQ